MRGVRVSAVVSVALLAAALVPAQAGVAAAQAACPSVDFTRDYPRDEELPWSENGQGVAHDATHWFFAQQGALISLPTNFPLHADPNFASSPNGELRRRLTDPAYGALGSLGINHFGDIDVYGEFVFAPLERSGGSYIAAFSTTTLELVSFVEITGIQGAKAGWLAIDAWTGLLYTSGQHVADYIFRYQVDLGVLRATGDLSQALTFVDQPVLREGDGTTLHRPGDGLAAWPLLHMQGGVFTPWGDLVIVNGYIDDDSDHDRGGVHIFRPLGASRTATQFHLVSESVNQTGAGGFRFAYDVDWDEEPEGVDWWDRAPGSPVAEAQGQLHAVMIDNTQFWEGESGPDDLYFKHFDVGYTCLPDFDGDGLSTALEIDDYGLDPLDWDTDGDHLSDHDEVWLVGSDPHAADTDQDWLPDGFEWANWGHVLVADVDADGLLDGLDVEFVQVVIRSLPASAFQTNARSTLLTRLDEAETQLVRGGEDQALAELEELVRSIGSTCGTRGPTFRDCTAQRDTSDALRLLLDNLRR